MNVFGCGDIMLGVAVLHTQLRKIHCIRSRTTSPTQSPGHIRTRRAQLSCGSVLYLPHRCTPGEGYNVLSLVHAWMLFSVQLSVPSSVSSLDTLAWKAPRLPQSSTFPYSVPSVRHFQIYHYQSTRPSMNVFACTAKPIK